MILLGICSLLQMILLPGLLIVTISKIRMSIIPKVIFIFGTSLLFNYLLVVLLSLFKSYSQISLLLIFFFEVSLLIWINRKHWLMPFDKAFEKIEEWIKTLEIYSIDYSIKSPLYRIVKLIIYLTLLILAVIDVVWVFQRFTNNIGTVFNTWDAIVSWNRWALDWSKGIFPVSTFFYPQLIPANWSLSYVFMNGVELQSFPKAIMPFFSLLILVMLFDLGVKQRSFGFFIGVVFTRLLIKKFTGSYIADGYVDLPIAFFSFASVYMLLNIDKNNESNEKKLFWIISGLIMVTAAAVTKQAGVFAFIVYPILISIFSSKNFMIPRSKQENMKLLLFFTVAFFVVLSWYLYKWIQISQGADSSNVLYVTQDIYHGASYIERFTDAIILLEKYGYFLLAIPLISFFIKPPFKWFGFLIVIPFSIIWIFFFSYEARNLALIFPFWGMLIGLFIQTVFDYSIVFLNKLKFQNIPIASTFLLIIMIFVFLAIKFPETKLTQNQIEKQWAIFNPELNEKIRNLVEYSDQEIKILTNYPVKYLPGLASMQVSYWYDNIDDYFSVMRNLEIDFLLVPNNIAQEVAAEIERGINSGELELLFSSEGAYSYQMIMVNN